MKTMREFYNSLPSAHAIRLAHKEHKRVLKKFHGDYEDLPSVLAATARLRSELEDLQEKPMIVTVCIDLLKSDDSMMRAIMSSNKKEEK